jgi:hypothetical protein
MSLLLLLSAPELLAIAIVAAVYLAGLGTRRREL